MEKAFAPGDRLGRLVVIERVAQALGVSVRNFYRLRCDCGNSIVVRRYRLDRGLIHSCGCGKRRGKKTRQARTPLTVGYHALVYSAKRRRLDVDITRERVYELMSSPCSYCGQTPINGQRNGVDRIDSAKGYTDSNSVPCCARCNRMKSDLSLADFLSAVKAIYEKCSIVSMPQYCILTILGILIPS